MIKECLLKVGIKLLKILCQNIIPCFLAFCSSNQSLLSLLNFKFLNILVKVKHAATIEAINTFVYYKGNTYLYPLHLINRPI